MLVWLSVSVSIWGRGVFRRVTGLSFGSIDNFGKLLMVLPLRLGGGGGSPSILASVPPVWRVHCSTAPTRSLSHGRAQVGIVFAQASRLVGVVREGVGFLQTLFAKACVQSKSALAKVSGVGVGLWAQAPLGWSAALSSLVNRSSDRRQSMRQRLDGGFFFPSLLARSQGSGPRFSGMGGSWGVQSSGSALGPLGVAGAASPAPLWGGAVRWRSPTEGGAFGRPLAIQGEDGGALAGERGQAVVGGIAPLVPLVRAWGGTSRPRIVYSVAASAESGQILRRYASYYAGTGAVSVVPRGRLGARQRAGRYPTLLGSFRPLAHVARNWAGSTPLQGLLPSQAHAGDFSSSTAFAFRQPQVRYRPGFMTHWRYHRWLLRKSAQLHQGAGQRRLTRGILRLRRLVSFSYFRLAQLSLVSLVALSWLVSLAGWSLFGLAQTKVAGGWVFFNGSRCLNPRQQLYVGDLLTIGANVSFGLNVPVVPLPNPHGWGVSIQPLAAGRTESDTPGFVEVDELTQTLGVLLEPRDWWGWGKAGTALLPFMTMKLYNWRYIT